MYLGEIKEGRKKGDPGNEVDGNAGKELTQIFENFVSLVQFKEFETFLSLWPKLLPLVRFFYNTQMESSYFSI